MSQSPIEMMQSIKKELETRLEATEEYRALKAINAAIAEMDGAKNTRTFAPLIRQRPQTFINASSRPITQGDAAAIALDEAGSPKTTAELIELARARGATVGGNDPLTNLASSLSRDPRFVTLRIDGKSYWWLQGRPLANDNIFPSFVFDGEGEQS